MMLDLRPRYLFVRLLEACNANCFMCQYALSTDSYRFTVEDLASILPQATALGVEFVRFTGGEPLLHRDILALVRAGADAGMGMSLITNGAQLRSMSSRLAAAGLRQVIVSIDGAQAETHDYFRGTPGLFSHCVDGLSRARTDGILTRVNTVVGPHNYQEVPALQAMLTQMGVSQWELSAVKLGRPIRYDDPAAVLAVCEAVYEADPRKALVPLGKRFYGDTPDEQARFFELGVTPRPGGDRCHLAGDVVYLDAKAGLGFACSLLPHRDTEESGGGTAVRGPLGWRLDSTAMRKHVSHFRQVGPHSCSGCSTTAAGYSDARAAGRGPESWDF